MLNRSLLPILVLAVAGPGCSTVSRHQPGSPPPETDSQKIARLEAQNVALSNSVTSLTSKMAELQNQLDTTRGRLDTWLSNEKALPSPVDSPSTEGAMRLPPAGGPADAEEGFSSDDAIRKYRQAMILFESHSYPDAILAFSRFMDQYPDHALAGSAQYYLGESYFKEGEYKLAAKELQRVITTYDRSPHISDTLRDLAIAESRLGMREDAERHRQLLTSLFPSSPAGLQAFSSAPDADSAPSAQAAAPPAQASANQNPAAPSPDNTAPQTDGLDAPPPTAPLTPGNSGASETQ